MRMDCAGDGRGVSRGGQGPQVVFHCFLDLQEEGSGVGRLAPVGLGEGRSQGDFGRARSCAGAGEPQEVGV